MDMFHFDYFIKSSLSFLRLAFSSSIHGLVSSPSRFPPRQGPRPDVEKGTGGRRDRFELEIDHLRHKQNIELISKILTDTYLFIDTIQYIRSGHELRDDENTYLDPPQNSPIDWTVEIYKRPMRRIRERLDFIERFLSMEPLAAFYLGEDARLAFRKLRSAFTTLRTSAAKLCDLHEHGYDIRAAENFGIRNIIQYKADVWAAYARARNLDRVGDTLEDAVAGIETLSRAVLSA